jgi:hypothetical protein
MTAATVDQVAALRERTARAAKAAALVGVVIEHLHVLELDTLDPAKAAEIVRLLPETSRRTCAELAGVRPPSPHTWAIVAGLIRTRLEHPHAYGHSADPFESLPR